MSRAFQEYIELFEDVGRGGAVRLSREQFEELDREFQALVAELGTPAADREQDRARRRRLAELKQLLLRDRP
jgi:hypothetical protein